MEGELRRIRRAGKPSAAFKSDWFNKPFSLRKCISVLKLLCDRIHSINETAHINADVGRMVQYIARCIHRSPFSMLALRVKMKYAGLLDSLLSKRDLLPLKKELSLRNTLLDIVSEWAFDPAVR